MNYVVQMLPVWVFEIERMHIWYDVNQLQSIFVLASRIDLVDEVSFLPEGERNVIYKIEENLVRRAGHPVTPLMPTQQESRETFMATAETITDTTEGLKHCKNLCILGTEKARTRCVEFRQPQKSSTSCSRTRSE